MTPTQPASTRSIADRIREAVEADRVELPPLPEPAVRLQRMLASEDEVPVRQVAELVSSEPAVAASLLRIANSAAFGGLREVTELNQAIARLGLNQVGSIVTALLLKGHFAAETKEKKQLLESLWDHAVVSAFAARHLAPRAGANGEEAFLAGLLHGCGRLLVLRAADHLEAQGLDLSLSHAALGELMDVLHVSLGHHTLKSWNLPEPICKVALRHEEEPVAGEALLLCVQAANQIARKLGFHPDPDPALELLSEPAIELLDLKDIELAALMVDLEDELQEIRKLF